MLQSGQTASYAETRLDLAKRISKSNGRFGKQWMYISNRRDQSCLPDEINSHIEQLVDWSPDEF